MRSTQAMARAVRIKKKSRLVGRDKYMGSLRGVGITPRLVKGFRLSTLGHLRSAVTSRTFRPEPDSVRTSRMQELSR